MGKGASGGQGVLRGVQPVHAGHPESSGGGGDLGVSVGGSLGGGFGGGLYPGGSLGRESGTVSGPVNYERNSPGGRREREGFRVVAGGRSDGSIVGNESPSSWEGNHHPSHSLLVSEGSDSRTRGPSSAAELPGVVGPVRNA